MKLLVVVTPPSIYHLCTLSTSYTSVKLSAHQKNDLLRELATVMEDLYHHLCIKCFGSRSPNKEERYTCWNIVTTLFVCLLDELLAVRLVAEDAFNYPYRFNKLYLWGVLQDHRVIAEFVKEKFTGRPKFHPHMVMFILETMVSRVEL